MTKPFAEESLSSIKRQISIIINDYEIPNNLLDFLEFKEESTINELYRRQVGQLVAQPLNKLNYVTKLHSLLYLEEYQNQKILSKYDINDVTIKSDGRYFAINVPLLDEGTPALIPGLKVVLFSKINSTDEDKMGVSKWSRYNGLIYEVRRDDILIKSYNKELMANISGNSFKVEFKLNRNVYQRCHHAIDMAPHIMEEILYPQKPILKPKLSDIEFESIDLFNKSLNNRQKRAVVGILQSIYRPTPFIIYGPPGTGKTVTVVEAILQVFNNIRESRIIACTSANTTADLMIKKLLESGRVPEKDMIRITAYHRANSVPENIRKVTQKSTESPKKWLNHRIIVTTTSQAGVFYGYDYSDSLFTHVFIDEAAHVTEPESLIPISMRVKDGVIVLAGDHKQLGPVVISNNAKFGKLDRSLMERLMIYCAPYKRNEKFKGYNYDYNNVVKLVVNYRSDEQIMRIPSKLFYENELKFERQMDCNLIRRVQLNSGVNFVEVEGLYNH